MPHSALGLAIRAGGLFDGERWLSGPVLVVVRGGCVVAVDTSGAAAPEDCELVDYGSRSSVVPGLIDAHSHLALDAARPMQQQMVDDSDEQVRAVIAANARLALLAGVTTIRDLGDRGFLTVEYANRQASCAAADGPFVVAAGPPITRPDGHCWFLGRPVGTVDDDTQLVKSVGELAERGVDVVKVMASSGMGADPHDTQFDRAALSMLVQAGAEHGLKVVAHAHAIRAIADSVAAGVWGIEHCSFMTAAGVARDDELVEAVAQKGIYVGCTVAKPRADMSPDVLATLEPYWANNAYMHTRGVKLVCCTDAGINPVKTHDVLPSDMAYFASEVTTTIDTLRSATTVAAASCGVADRKGAIKQGMDADLVVVAGNPIDDIGALCRVQAVYRDGAIVDQGMR